MKNLKLIHKSKNIENYGLNRRAEPICVNDEMEINRQEDMLEEGKSSEDNRKLENKKSYRRKRFKIIENKESQFRSSIWELF
jgi:hypothetical protein